MATEQAPLCLHPEVGCVLYGLCTWPEGACLHLHPQPSEDYMSADYRNWPRPEDWAEHTAPTPDQVVRWITGMPPAELEHFFGVLLAAAETANACIQGDHMEEIKILNSQLAFMHLEVARLQGLLVEATIPRTTPTLL